MHGSIAAVLCLIARDDLPPFAYALFTLSIAGALLALPLLGDFGYLLRADPSREWVEALPVRASELRIARTMSLLMLVFVLSMSTLLPIALLAPASVGLVGKLVLFGAGFAQALFVTAGLLGFQSLFGHRAESMLVLLQTILVGGIVLGCVVGPRLVPALVDVHAPKDLGAALAFLPSAWFATSLAARDTLEIAWRASPWIALFVAIAILTFAPQATLVEGRRRGWLAIVLAPVRRLAARVWVRRDERGAFDLVFDALPLEREFVLRTYPMIGLPLAMLVTGARGPSGAEREALITLLLFSPAIYLPVLLVHVPATSSPEARWILEGAPVSRAAIDNGALKALAIRFLVPLYFVLFAFAWAQVGVEFALRLAPAGFLVTLILTRKLYAMCVTDLPLSTEPGSIQAKMDWTGSLMGLAFVLTLVSVAAFKLLTTMWIALAVVAVLAFVDWRADRRAITEA